MSDEQLKMILRVFGSHIAENEDEIVGVTKALIDVTVKFRDKLKNEIGYKLTVEDTQIALDGFEAALKGDPLPDDLTSEQRALAQIYLDRMTLFRNS